MKTNIVTTDDILLKLCDALCDVLTKATHAQVRHSAMVQKIKQIGLKPDLGCFVVFDGGFSGLVIINFSAAAAMEIYHDYLIGMGMPEEELAKSHTSDEVANVMGELMNQILGNFIAKISKDLQTNIEQTQPKMLTVNKQLNISIDANLDQAISRRVSFMTAQNNVFYVEFSIDNTEFMQLKEFETNDHDFDPDKIFEKYKKDNKKDNTKAEPKIENKGSESVDLLASLGL